MDEKKREEIALFRYGLIVPFLSQEEIEWGVKGEILKRLAAGIQLLPFSKKTSLASSTIRRYLALYHQKGFDGLKPKNRSDIGKSQKIPSDILEQTFLLKREEPGRSAGKIIRIMEAHQMVKPGLLKPSTLYRIFNQNGLTNKQLKKTKKSFRSFQAERPNQIWQSDVMYGPFLPDPDRPGAQKRTYLVVMIDDFSRMIPHSEFYWHERLPNLENTLQKAILKRGIPEVFYVDNGSIYSAHQINTICAELGIRKISCRPYSPEGKGKVERFIKTVRSDFLSELKHERVEHLHQLNSKYWAWLEQEYHQRHHSSTKETPIIRWRQNIAGFLRKIEEKQLQNIFLWRQNRTVNKVGIVSLDGLKFEVASFLVGKKIEIRYNPFDLSQVFIYHEDRLMQKARQTTLPRWNTAKKQNVSQANAANPPVKTDIKHLAHLENLHHQSKVKQAKELIDDSQPPSPQKKSFTSAHFFKAVANMLNRKIEDFHANEIEEMQEVWDTYAPFEWSLIHLALVKATLVKGTDQHISFYLDHIVNSHLNYQKSKNIANKKEN